MARAAAVSIPRMTPCAWRLRTITAWAWPSALTSSVKRPSPRTSLGSSLRLTGWPMPNFEIAQLFGSFCRFIYCLRSLEVTGGRAEIEDKARLHKDLCPSYATPMQLLREAATLLHSDRFGIWTSPRRRAAGPASAWQEGLR